MNPLEKAVKSDKTATLIWVRRDFRVANNPALNFAIGRGGPIIAIYIEPDDLEMGWRQGAAARWWCYHSLQKFETRLAEQGIRLHFFKGNTSHILASVVKESGATAVCWNRLYEPDQIQLEKQVLHELPNIELQPFDSHLLFTPGTILNQQEQAYRVFTPFWKNARSRLEVSGVSLVKTRKNKQVVRNQRFKLECSLRELRLLDEYPWYKKLEQHWIPGEVAAQKRIKQFIKNSIEGYDNNRDIPSLTGTSKISPHLHFGEITPAQIVYQLMSDDLLYKGSASVERFLTELGWREFAHHILWHFPNSTQNAMYEKFKNFWPKKANRKLLTAWQTGNTGIPIVDAGMRELWETGWMHNRVRMIVGSFLTKNLGIHWLHGAKWFWDTLVDADLANNTMGWQWVAGCGVDAAPYYRIFNPFTQAQRFDQNMTYITKWVKELNDENYSPVIDIAASRDNALKRYNEVKNKHQS